MDLVRLILNTQPTQEDVQALLKKLRANDKALPKLRGQLDQAIETLNPALHTLGLSFLLSYKASTEFQDLNLFLRQASLLLMNADPWQVAIAPKYYANVCATYARTLVLCNSPMLGINTLRRAVDVMHNNNRHLLTPAHAEYVKVCIKAKCYADALDVLEVPIYEVKPKETGITALDVLTYYYHGGIAYIGLKQFDKALEMLQMVLAVPSRVISAVQIQAYKKYVLVSLIHHRDVVELPQKFVSPVVHRMLSRVCFVYSALCHAFKAGPDELRKTIEENKLEYKQDNNLGLVKQIVNVLVRRRIQRLTGTYVTLSLAEIAQSAELKSPEEAEQHVLHMIEDGAIFATINQREGIVSFQDNPEQFDTTDMALALDAKVKEAMYLRARIEQAHRELQVDPTYLSKVMQSKDRNAAPGGGGSSEDAMLKRALQQSLMDK